MDEQSVADVAKKVIETGEDTTTSTMLVGQSNSRGRLWVLHHLHSLKEKLSTTFDLEQYKLFSCERRSSTFCVSPSYFRSVRFREFHPHSVKISSSKYDKSWLLNKDSRFLKDPQVASTAFLFGLYWTLSLHFQVLYRKLFHIFGVDQVLVSDCNIWCV